MKYIIFFYNPISGERLILSKIDAIIHMYQRASRIVIPIRISMDLGYNPLKELYSKFGDQIDHVLIAGGDGSVNRLVNFMMKNNIDLPVAILPAGTANDFASMLGMPNDLLRATKSIITGKEKRYDLGKANEKYFVNIFSCGLFTEISHRTPTKLKNTIGKLAYYLGSIGELPSFKKFKISIKSSEMSYEGEGVLLMIFNGRTAGNLPLAKLSDASDGVLDVFLLKGSNITNAIKTVFHFLVQQKAGNYPDDVIYFQTNKLDLNIQPDVVSDVDGEQAGAFPMQITCVPRSLRIITPNEAIARDWADANFYQLANLINMSLNK